MQKLFARSTLAAAALFSVFGYASGQTTDPLLKAITDSLASTDHYASEADFMVSMPQMPDDIIYSLTLYSTPSHPGDTLSSCDYLIDWQLVTTDNDRSAKGFSAYYDGNHYRYNGGNRLQEYHVKSDPNPFVDRSTPLRRSPGVHRAAQFANFLPRYMAEDINLWRTDSCYNFHTVADTVVDGMHHAAIRMIHTYGGEIVQEGEYLFDPASFLPRRIVLENNPGALSEQTLSVKFRPLADQLSPSIDEDILLKLYPEIFERFRESSFRVESLKGSRLPAFSLPTLTGERYSRAERDRFRSPAAILFFDPAGAFAAEAVADIKAAADQLPYTPQLIFAALSTNIDQIEELLPEDHPDQYRLMSAGGFARDCGVAQPPVLLIVGSDGKIADVMVGYNKSFRSDIIQKMGLLRP